MDYQSVSGTPKNNSMAVVSLVAGIAGWVLVLLTTCGGVLISIVTMGIGSVCLAPFGCLTPIGWLVAVITGHIAKNQIQQTNEGGNGMATAGLIMGYIGLGLFVVTICLGVILGLIGAISIPWDQIN
jgi:hypothetical protein